MVKLEVEVQRTLGSFALHASFAAPAGITALFGPSGSGKTLTLRAIAGLLRPERGRIALGGRALFDAAAGIDVPTRERRVGLVFQQYALFPHLTVAANIAYGLRSLSASARSARVRQMLEMADMTSYGGRFPRELSGGQQQRVAVARALAPGADLLLLDEPFAAVDTFLRRRLRDQLREIQVETGVPMLFVTHDLAEVRQLADTLVVYGHGVALQAGATSEVLHAPVRETADLLSGEISV